MTHGTPGLYHLGELNTALDPALDLSLNSLEQGCLTSSFQELRGVLRDEVGERDSPCTSEMN